MQGSDVTKDWGFVKTKTDKSMCLFKGKNDVVFDVPGIGEDLAVDGFQLVGAWPEHFRDDV